MCVKALGGSKAGGLLGNKRSSVKLKLGDRGDECH